MTNEIQRIEHLLWMHSQGANEDEAYLRKKLAEAYAQEASELRNTLEAVRIYAEHFGGISDKKLRTVTPQFRGPVACDMPPFISMGMDQYIDHNRVLRETSEALH